MNAYRTFLRALQEHIKLHDADLPEFVYTIPANKLMELKVDFEFAANASPTGPVTCIFDGVPVRFNVTRADNT